MWVSPGGRRFADRENALLSALLFSPEAREVFGYTSFPSFELFNRHLSACARDEPRCEAVLVTAGFMRVDDGHA